MALAAPLAAGAFAQSGSQAFPYGHELRLDADPIRGSKKVPILDIGDNGNAEIDLWCDNVRAQLIVAGNTLTIIAGARSSRQCGPDLARADDELLTALSEVTGWRMENSALVLTGGRTLQFLIQTN
jgi:heat shock protein HslJ